MLTISQPPHPRTAIQSTLTAPVSRLRTGIPQRPAHYIALDAVLALNDRNALEDYCRAEQGKRDRCAAEQFRLYRLADDRKGVVKLSDGTTYDFQRDADGTVTCPFVPDQQYCDRLNAALRRLKSCVRLETKHSMIRLRLLEVEPTPAGGWWARC